MPENNKRRIEYMPVSELMTRLHPANPKGHDIEMIAQSFQDHGFVSSGTLDQRTGYFLCGHGRTETLAWMIEQQMAAPRYIEQHDDGWHCPVECGYESLNDAQALAYLVMDNQSTIAGDWDKQKLAELLTAVNNSEDIELPASGFNQEQLKEIMTELANQQESAEDPGAQIDKAGELQEQWQVQRGDLWQIGAHRVMCGDSTNADDVKLLMGEAEIEVVWADPPYGVAVGDKNKFLNSIAPSNRVEENLTNDNLDEPQLIDMLCGSFDLAIKYCHDGGAWYVAAPPGPLHVLFGQVLKDRGIWRQTIQWVKNNATFSPMGVDYHWKSEPIFYGWLPNAGHRYYGGRKQTTVWEIDRPLKSPEHPTMKPVELVARAIKNSSRQYENVYDPFLGSGTTLIACEQTGRTGYGMEIAPEYVAVTLQRMSDFGLSPVLIEKPSGKDGTK